MKPHPIAGSLIALALGSLGLAGCEKGKAEEAQEEIQTSPRSASALKPGFRDLALLHPGQSRGYFLHLRAGDYLHLVIEQLDVDVVATIADASGNLLQQMDGPAEVPEELFLVATATGRHDLVIRPWDETEGGRFTLRVATLRKATRQDRKRAAAADAYSRARLLGREQSASAQAAASYRVAAGLWRELEDVPNEGWALYRLGRLLIAEPARRREGIEALTQALDCFRRSGAERQAGNVLFYLGEAWEGLGDLDLAGRSYEEALALWERLGDLPHQAARLNDLAILRMRQGREHAAIDLYTRSIEIWQRAGEWGELATTRTNLGILYASLGENRMALENYHLALGLLEQQPESRQKAVTLSKLGDVLLESEGPETALEKYREALILRRRLHDTRGQAVTLNSMGLAHLEANRPLQAFRDFSAAVEILSHHQEPVDQSMVLSNLALAYERLDRPERARELYQQALALGAQDRRTSGVALFGLARVARMEGALDEAERWVEQSLDSVEAIRSQVWRPDLRSTYHAAQQEQYAFLIDLLAERHRLEPERGHAARAFAAAERARARSLLDLLSAARHRPSPQELSRLDHLSRQINSRHRKWLSASTRGIADDGVDRELTSLLERWRQEKVAAEGPRLPESGARPTLSLEQVQARLLDERTLLLQYFLGEEKSFLWAITSSTVRLIDTLPGRQQIEQAALQVRERMAVSHQQTDELAARQAAAKLSRMILGPVADLLSRQRLVIIAPGPLQTVPFAALPNPGLAGVPFSSEQRPLIVDHEIVNLPSASVLGALRSRAADRRQPSGLLAILADPVLERSDERLAGDRSGSQEGWLIERGGRGGGGPENRWGLSLQRLPFAGREAEEILALVGSRPVLAASGFAASRGLVKSGRLSHYRILHFATHSLYNDLHPELSILVLSNFDVAGRPVDGHLRAYEIADLELRADLVVLSACRTGLSEEEGGEGRVGLTQGFLNAGVPRLVASLWNVDDRATSELMKRFYTAFLHGNLPPAQALREAQISFLREKRWSAPYHWAGFAFHGEWE